MERVECVRGADEGKGEDTCRRDEGAVDLCCDNEEYALWR